MGNAEPKRIVERYLAEVLNGGRPENAAELIADEVFRRHVDGFRAAFPDLRVSTRTMLAEGDRVAVHLAGYGTHLGVFQGCPPTGREWAASCTAIYRIDEGRIVDVRVNWDLLALLEQLGCIERAATVSA